LLVLKQKMIGLYTKMCTWKI